MGLAEGADGTMIVLPRRHVRLLTDRELRRECRRLSREWELRGRPDENEMPALMLCNYLLLQEERERRGEQLELF
jgi:hypothetical protein